MNEIYIVDGQKFDVAPNRKEEFLKKYPNATLYIEPTIPKDMGKIAPPQADVTGAAVEETKAPDMDFKQEDISLELPEDEKPGVIESLAAATVKGFARAFRGTQAAAETAILSTYAGVREGLMNDPMSTDEKIAFRKALAMGVPGSNIMATSQYDGVINDLNEHIRKTESEGVTDALTKGKYKEAAFLATTGVLESIPSVAASFLGPGGLVLLGGSVAGNKFDEEFEANPEESLNRLALNAVGTGVTEAAFERFTMGLAGRAKAALGSGKKGAAESAKKILEEGFLNVGKRLGLDIGGEALSEGATEAANIGVDYLTLDRELPTDQILKRISDGAIIGGLMGGTLSSVSAIGNNSNAARNRAEYILTPDADKKEMQESAARISNLALDLKNADENATKIIQEELIKEEQKIINIKKKTSINLQALDKNELSEYAKNIDEIERAKQIKEPLSAANIAKEKIQTLSDKNNEIIAGAKERQSEQTIISAEKSAKDLNIKFNAFETAKEVEEYLGNIKDSKTIAETKDGFIIQRKDGSQEIIVNKEVAKETEAVNVAAHELLHGILFKTLKDNPQAAINLGQELANEINKLNSDQIQNSILRKRLDLYKNDPASIQGEEMLALFSDATATGDIKYNENIFTKIGDSVRRLLQDLGFKKIQFNTGRDVYNFIKDYNKGIKEGGVRKAIINQAAKGFTGKLVDVVKTTQEDVTKFSKSEASDKVQQIYNDQGVAGAMDIIERFNPIVNKLVNKYRDVPGFEYQILKDEIETGQRGILDMIMAYNPEKNKGVPLAAYINKFLPARMIEVANRNLGTEFTLDVTEAKGVTDTATEEQIEAAEETIIADEIKSLRKEIGLPEELITNVKNAVIKTFGTRLPSPEDPKFRLELQRRFRTELKKPMAKFVGKQEAYESFLRDNFKAIYNKMPLSLILRRFKDFADPVLDKNGKQLRERTAEGNKIFTKKKITAAEFVKYFLGADVGRSTQGTRKTAIVEAIAEEIAFDATMEVLNDQEVLNKYQEIAEITEVTLPENFKVLIAKQIDRAEDFKFSSSITEIGKTKYNLSEQELARELFNNTLLEIAKGRPDIYDALTNESFRRSFPKTFNEIIVPAFNKIIKESDPAIAEQITIHFIKTYSRPVRTFSRKETPLSSTTNKLFFNSYIKPALEGTGLLSNDKFNLVEKNNKTYLNYGSNPIVNLIDVTSKATIKDIMSGKISKEEVLQQNNAARAELDYIIFNLGSKNKGLALSIIKLAQKDQRTLFRNAAPLYSVVQNYTGDTVYEHNPPVQYVFEQIADYLQDQTSAKKEAVKKLLNTMEANIVPKDFAKIVDSKYKNTIPTDGSLRYQEAIDKTNYKFDDSNFKFSSSKASLNKGFNEILQASTGVKWTENYSPSTAKMLARGKGKGNLFIPYSAEDFVGLLYTTLAKGKIGDQQMEWYNENLIRPFSRGIQAYEAEKQRAMREWSVLKQRATKDVPGGLKKKNESGFTNEESLRMYMWQRQGMEIPNIQKGEVNKAIRAVRNNKKFKEFADTLMSLNPEGYPEPSNNWIDGDITSDLVGYVNGAKRAEFLTQWKENVDQIFSEKNKTKLRALYGDRYVEALEDMLFRMEKGTNRSRGTNKQTRAWMDWVNNSVGTIMFFNARSAVLQTLSTVNFINFSDNNPINAATALANFSQYRQDFVDLFNSDFLKQRRSGLQIDVNADEIAKATKGNEKSPRAILRALLQFGFTPTQIADSFAIAAGGATFYRNRINKYTKEGLNKTEAEKKAFTDFQEIAEETQQSARPDRISMEQASSLGRVILAFANTPMQYARLQKKAFLDLTNGRGDWKTNTSKIMYYGVIQNVIFSALQQALFALLFDDEDDEEKKNRYYRIGNSSLDTLLRGVGVAGAGLATVKNIILEIIDQAKSKRPDYTQAAIAATSISPPINSKLRKLLSAGRAFTYKQSREKIFTEGLSLKNPALLAAGQVLSAGANIPADRVVLKADHLYTAMQPETELWQAIALSLGWSEWDLGMIEKQSKKPADLDKELRKLEKLLKKKY